MSTPASIRITDDGFKALKILEVATKKTRTQLVSEALVEKATGTLAAPIIKCRLLATDEILILQSEIAAVEKLHSDNRRNVKIRTSDRAATEKIIKLIEKIEVETGDLRALKAKLAKLAEVVGSLTPDDHIHMETLITFTENGIKSTDAKEHPPFKLMLKILKNVFEP